MVMMIFIGMFLEYLGTDHYFSNGGVPFFKGLDTTFLKF